MDKRWNVFQQDKQSPVTGDSFIITIILIILITAAWVTSAKRSRSNVVLFFSTSDIYSVIECKLSWRSKIEMAFESNRMIAVTQIRDLCVPSE